MENLFNFMGNAYFNNPKNNKRIEKTIFNWIPLNDIGNPFIPFKEFKKELSKAANSTATIEEIAELSLKLCAPYLKYHPYLIKTDDTKAVEVFLEHIFGNDSGYLTELKNHIILSYFYGINISDKKIAKTDDALLRYYVTKKTANIKSCQASEKNPINKRIENQKTINQKVDNVNARVIVDKFYLFNKKRSSLDFFFSDEPLDSSSNTITINSWLDVEIILSLTNSCVKSKNPFLISNDTTSNNNSATSKRIPTKIDLFLKNFQNICLYKDSLVSILKSMDESTQKSCNITFTELSIYNQYFLERFTNLNFINKFYEIKDSILPKRTLFSLVNLPLLKFRLRILDFYDKYNKLESIYPIRDLRNWEKLLTNVVNQQVICTLPILSMTFHYLMNLLNNKNKETIGTSIEGYFNTLYKEYKEKQLFYFKYNYKSMIEPILYKISDTDSLYKNTSYIEFSNRVYAHFGLPMICHDSFNKHLKSILTDRYSKWLISQLCKGNAGFESLFHQTNQAAVSKDNCTT